MMKWVSRALSAIGLPGDVQLIAGIVFASGAFGVFAGWISWARVNPHWALLIGFGVCASALWSFVGIQIIFRANRVFRSLFFASSEPFGVEVDASGSLFLPLQVRLQNTSSRELFFKVVRAELELEGRTNKSAPKGTLEGSIPPGQQGTIRVPAVPDLKFKAELSGSFEFEVEYGKRPDDLRYRLRYTFEPWFRMPQVASSDSPQVPLIYDGKCAAVEHHKIKWL